MSETTAEYGTINVLEAIENARLKGDFDLVKRLSKTELENPQSDINALEIMNQIAHMYLDCFLIWVHEMQKIEPTVNKYSTLSVIAQHLKSSDISTDYTEYIKEMRRADAEEVRNIFLSVDDDVDDRVEKAKEDMKKQGL